MSRAMREALAESLGLNKELIDLLHEAFAELFPGKRWVKYSLDEDIESGFPYNGCLQGIEHYRDRIEREQKAREKQKETENE